MDFKTAVIIVLVWMLAFNINYTRKLLKHIYSLQDENSTLKFRLSKIMKL